MEIQSEILVALTQDCSRLATGKRTEMWLVIALRSWNTTLFAVTNRANNDYQALELTLQ